LHGIASDGSCWDETIKYLNHQDLRLIVIDLLGFGKSPKPNRNAYSLKSHAKSIEKTIKKMRINNQELILVGHSMGALIAIELAKRHKLKISKLILCSPPLYLPEDYEDSGIEYSKTAKSKNNVYFALYKLILSNPKVTLKSAKLVAAGFSDFELTKENWIPFKKSLLNSIQAQTSLKDIQQIEPPVEIIYGLLDLLIMPKNYKLLKDSLPNLKITKTSAGHFISNRYAKKIAKLLLTGLAKKP
jgi:pimeloyl-ACP methyl ester carboxylesterase